MILCSRKGVNCSLVVIIQLVSHTNSLPFLGLQHARFSCLFTISCSLLKLMSIEAVMPSNRLILCCPLLLMPSFFPSIRVFSSESALRIRWPKHWSFSFRIGHSREYSGVVPFRIGGPLSAQCYLCFLICCLGLS